MRARIARMDDLRYPIGRFAFASDPSPEQRRAWIRWIADAPAQLRQAVSGLSDSQLDTPYRPDGWTLRQVVHHVPDSHLNAYVRFKLALTEETPTIKPYDENEWARLPDAKGPVDDSLMLLEALHRRWVILLESMTASDFARQLGASGPGSGQQRLAAPALFLARPAPHGACDLAAAAKRVVGARS